MKSELHLLFEKFKSGTLTDEERRLFNRYFFNFGAERDLKQLLEGHLDELADLEQFDGEQLYENLWNQIKNKVRIAEKSNRYRVLSSFRRFAAVLILALAVAAGIRMLINEVNEEIPFELLTSGAEKIQFELPDGSLVYLNDSSTLQYRIVDDQDVREVILNGEAWFDVVKSEKPFLVRTNYYNIEVLGTRFNVVAAEALDLVETTLLEGSVAISRHVSEKDERMLLVPGQQLVLNKNSGDFVVNDVNPAVYSAWTGQRLEFSNLSFSDFAILLERRYGVGVEVLDEELFELKYDGVIRHESLTELLDIVKVVFPVEYIISDKSVTIKKRS